MFMQCGISSPVIKQEEHTKWGIAEYEQVLMKEGVTPERTKNTSLPLLEARFPVNSHSSMLRVPDCTKMAPPLLAIHATNSEFKILTLLAVSKYKAPPEDPLATELKVQLFTRTPSVTKDPRNDIEPFATDPTRTF
jgi:hypothetical protein